MNTNVIHIGLDVDDTNFHGAALDRETGQCLDFRCRPTVQHLLKQLEKVRRALGGERTLKLCYEATYIGFALQRELAAAGVDCAVIAPSSIPTQRGRAVKTDRLDAAALAQFYANGLLSEVTAPEAEQEADRDLLRSRQQLVKQQGDLRRHLQGLLRRNGHHYRAAGDRSHHR
jgi:transposase